MSAERRESSKSILMAGETNYLRLGESDFEVCHFIFQIKIDITLILKFPRLKSDTSTATGMYIQVYVGNASLHQTTDFYEWRSLWSHENAAGKPECTTYGLHMPRRARNWIFANPRAEQRYQPIEMRFLTNLKDTVATDALIGHIPIGARHYTISHAISQDVFLALVNFEMTLGYDNNNRTSVNNQKK
jgi:hypothetical protein